MVKVKMRKPLHGEAMVRYSTRLRPDQVEVLKRTGEAAELIRSWIDKGLDDILGDREPILIQRKITALEGQITRIRNMTAYKKASTIAERGCECYSDFMKALEAENTSVIYRRWMLYIRKRTQDDLVDEELFDMHYAPGWPNGWKSYLEEQGVINQQNRYSDTIFVPKEHAKAILAKAIEAYPNEVKAREPYDAEIAKLEAERQKLRQRLAEVQ
jgi:hypothetical protein